MCSPSACAASAPIVVRVRCPSAWDALPSALVVFPLAREAGPFAIVWDPSASEQSPSGF
ncbi:hypothetical protein [Bacillus methanolicus]|uniref:hypothetical protein n=1 Tax=Bacillus methanolicus TaxID=1471 RepID=UPI00200D64C1|nr:hypothetical protein [Bacillus methanolicus]